MANSHLKLLNLAEPVAVAGGVDKMTLEGGIQKIGDSLCKAAWFRFSASYVWKNVDWMVSYLKHISICLTMTAAHEVAMVGFYSREGPNGRKQRVTSSNLVFVDIFARGTQKNPCFVAKNPSGYPTMRRNPPWIASRSIIPMALCKTCIQNPLLSRHWVVHKSKGHHGNGLGWAECRINVAWMCYWRVRARRVLMSLPAIERVSTGLASTRVLQ